jgi:hypothetical protein
MHEVLEPSRGSQQGYSDLSSDIVMCDPGHGWTCDTTMWFIRQGFDTGAVQTGSWIICSSRMHAMLYIYDTSVSIVLTGISQCGNASTTFGAGLPACF